MSVIDLVDLVDRPIDLDSLLRGRNDSEAGGLVLFVGRVRAATKGRAVLRLEYEAYRPMALAELEALAALTRARFAIRAIDVVHRVGTLEIGAIAVAIAVEAEHRAAAFDACRFAIDALKRTVPIWKKEIYGDGSEWIGDRP